MAASEIKEYLDQDENGTFQVDVFTMENFDQKIQKGMDDIENGRVYTIEEVEAEMDELFKRSESEYENEVKAKP